MGDAFTVFWPRWRIILGVSFPHRTTWFKEERPEIIEIVDIVLFIEEITLAPEVSLHMVSCIQK